MTMDTIDKLSKEPPKNKIKLKPGLNIMKALLETEPVETTEEFLAKLDAQITFYQKQTLTEADIKVLALEKYPNLGTALSFDGQINTRDEQVVTEILAIIEYLYKSEYNNTLADIIGKFPNFMKYYHKYISPEILPFQFQLPEKDNYKEKKPAVPPQENTSVEFKKALNQAYKYFTFLKNNTKTLGIAQKNMTGEPLSKGDYDPNLSKSDPDIYKFYQDSVIYTSLCAIEHDVILAQGCLQSHRTNGVTEEYSTIAYGWGLIGNSSKNTTQQQYRTLVFKLAKLIS